MAKRLKFERVEGKTFEYWIDIPNVFETPKLIIEAENWKEADKIMRSVLKAIRNTNHQFIKNGNKKNRV